MKYTIKIALNIYRYYFDDTSYFHSPFIRVQYTLQFNCVPIRTIMARERYTWRGYVVKCRCNVALAHVEEYFDTAIATKLNFGIKLINIQMII